jgi:hypothetical protein
MQAMFTNETLATIRNAAIAAQDWILVDACERLMDDTKRQRGADVGAVLRYQIATTGGVHR